MTSNDTRNSSEDIHRNAFHRHVEHRRRLIFDVRGSTGTINRMGQICVFSPFPASQWKEGAATSLVRVDDDSDGLLFDRAQKTRNY
jgi:hypothetical protein